MQDDFYLRLEARFRGSIELIRQRLRVYLPLTAQVQALHPGGLAVDVGCGRGEWLELMQEQGFEILGIDTNADMVAVCQQKGLTAECADAFERLATFESESVAIVSGFHIAEHLPFDTLMALMEEANRVLKPGGLLILETPNPENLDVGLWAFYMDPTHRHPIPAPLLQFLGEEAGFAYNHLLKLNGPDKPGPEHSSISRIIWALNAHPDSSLVAQKALHAGTPLALGEFACADLSPPLQQIKVELEQLRQEWEQLHQANHAVNEEKNAHKERADMLENHYQATRQALYEAQSQLHDAQSKFHALEQQASDIYHQLMATHNSLSWRITKPLRFINLVIHKGPSKVKSLLIKGLRLSAKIAIQIPGMRALAHKALNRIPKLRRLKDKLQGASADSVTMSNYQSEQRTRISRDIAHHLGGNQEKHQEGDQ